MLPLHSIHAFDDHSPVVEAGYNMHISCERLSNVPIPLTIISIAALNTYYVIHSYVETQRPSQQREMQRSTS